MGVQTQIDRISSAVTDQTTLLDQALALIEGKAAGGGSGGTESLGLLDSGSFTVTSLTTVSTKQITHAGGKVPLAVIVYTTTSGTAVQYGLLQAAICDNGDGTWSGMESYCSSSSSASTIAGSGLSGSSLDWTDSYFVIPSSRKYRTSKTYYWRAYG